MFDNNKPRPFKPDPKPEVRTKNKPKRINRSSPKRAREEREYKKERDIWILDKDCARCKMEANECHHMKGRISSLLLNKEFWLPVCTPCHQYIELNPIEAKEKGWSLSRG